jgi:hypothetical protein
MCTERGGSRAPSPFEPKLVHDTKTGATVPSNADLTDRKPTGERDEIASSVVLGYN